MGSDPASLVSQRRSSLWYRQLCLYLSPPSDPSALSRGVQAHYRDVQLVRRHLLHRVPRLAVKDEEQRLVAKVADFGVGWRRLDVVACRQRELGLDVEHLRRLGVRPGRDKGRVQVAARSGTESQLSKCRARGARNERQRTLPSRGRDRDWSSRSRAQASSGPGRST